MAGSGNDSIVVAGTAITSTLRAGVGDDLMSIAGGIALVRCMAAMAMTALTSLVVLLLALVDTGSGVDSVLLGASCRQHHLDRCVDQHFCDCWCGADSILVKANVASGYFDISAGAGNDTLNLLSSSVSAVSTTIKGGAGADVVSLYGANDVVFNVSSGDLSLVEPVRTPCCSPDQWSYFNQCWQRC